jgi:glutamine synthetase type III
VLGECKRLRDEIDYFVVDEDVYELGREDAERRFGYRAPENTFEAIQILDDRKNIEFLIQGGVFTEEMIRAFKMVQLENYVERVRAEARVTSHMAKVLGNKVLRSPLMSIPPHHLAEIEQRLRERQIYLGKLSADLIMKIDGSTLCDEKASNGEDIRGLLVCMRKMDNYDEMALLVVSRLLPLLAGIRFIYEEIVEIIGGSEEVSRM